MGSDPDLALSDLDVAGPDSGSGTGDFDLSEFQLGVATPDIAPPSMQIPTTPDSEDDILLDDLSLPPNPMTNSSSTIIGMEPTGKRPSDSDVRLVPETPKGASDSDVRLGGAGAARRPPSDSDVTLVSEDLQVPGSSDEAIPVAGPGDTAVRARPDVGSSAEVHVDAEDSDFELMPSAAKSQPPDSGSDFELEALDLSDEFETTPLTKPSDSDVTGALPSESGINLAKPSDSGINLQGFGGLDLDESGSIELAPLDEDEAPPPPKPAPKPAAPAKGAGHKAEMSATALPVKGEKDIFEDTDFEVDALGSDQDDQTVQLEAASDFDLDDSDSASEVYAIDEDDVDQSAATSLAPAVLDEDDESGEEEAFDVETEGAADDAWEEETAPVASGAAVAGPALATAAPAAEWGGLWVGFLMAATLFMMILAFISMDLVRNMYSYRGTTFASGLVKQIADLFGG